MKPNKFYSINSKPTPVQFKEYLFTNQPNDWFVDFEDNHYHIPSEEPTELDYLPTFTETYRKPSEFASKK